MLWRRKYTTHYAEREDGIVIQKSAVDARQLVASGLPTGGSPLFLPWNPDEESWVTAVEVAIAKVDAMFPPKGWTVTDGVWTADGWTVRPVEFWDEPRRHEVSFLLEGKTAPRYFTTPDRARYFADTTDGRAPRPRRGPKARAGKPASVILPDVRVIPEEREAATALAKAIRISYADLVRASLAFIRTQVLDEKNVVAVRRHDTEAIQFVYADALVCDNKATRSQTIAIDDALVSITVLTPQ